jgi:hypothetical protein
MISNYTIITIPQWAIFAGITVMIYGWFEKKRIFGRIGAGILVLLGLYAGWILWTGSLIPEGVLDTTDPLGGEELFSPDELPLEGRLLPHYWGMLLNGGIALIALVADLTRKKSALTLKIVAGSLALVIFFLMMGVLKA